MLHDTADAQHAALGAGQVRISLQAGLRELQILQAGAHAVERVIQLMAQRPWQRFEKAGVLMQSSEQIGNAARQVADLISRPDLGIEARPLQAALAVNGTGSFLAQTANSPS